MRCVYLYVWSLILAYSSIQGTPIKDATNGEKVTDLKEKLLKLQRMLSDIGQDRQGETTLSDEREPTDRRDRLKALANKLAERERPSYSALDRALGELEAQNKVPRYQDTTGEELGKFLENAADDRSTVADDTSASDADDKKTLPANLERQILRLLHSDTPPPRTVPRAETQQPQSQQTIEEGHFGDFRHEVLHAVENRLMSDLKMALRSGLTVKEVISDLESADSQWSDSNKRSEITRELDRLARLREKSSM